MSQYSVVSCLQATARSAPDREKEINNLVSMLLLRYFIALQILFFGISREYCKFTKRFYTKLLVNVHRSIALMHS